MLQVYQEAVLASVQVLIGCLVAPKPVLDCSLAKLQHMLSIPQQHGQ